MEAEYAEDLANQKKATPNDTARPSAKAGSLSSRASAPPNPELFERLSKPKPKPQFPGMVWVHRAPRLLGCGG